MLNGDELPFDENAARRNVELSYDQAGDPAAIKAPAQIIHGTARRPPGERGHREAG